MLTPHVFVGGERMRLAAPLIDELETALGRPDDPARCSEILHRITDLFADSAASLSEQQIEVFDDVLLHLIDRIELKALIRLGAVLAPIENSPGQVIRRLAFDDRIAVAGPVLAQSERLSEADLIEIAKSKGDSHRLAIAARARIPVAVSDVLVAVGDIQVKQQLARNTGAKFSEAALRTLLKDDVLAEAVRERLDLPLHLLRELLTRAAHTVHHRLSAKAPTEAHGQIQEAVIGIAHEVSWEAMRPRDFSAAMSAVRAMKESGQLSEAALTTFARERKYEEMAAALSVMSDCPVALLERLMKNVQPDALLVACKVAALEWETTRTILHNRFGRHAMPESDMARAREVYSRLSAAAARTALDFWKARDQKAATANDVGRRRPRRGTEPRAEAGNRAARFSQNSFRKALRQCGYDKWIF
jgi:uncharacterized protein (DUF2336 family)